MTVVLLISFLFLFPFLTSPVPHPLPRFTSCLGLRFSRPTCPFEQSTIIWRRPGARGVLGWSGVVARSPSGPPFGPVLVWEVPRPSRGLGGCLSGAGPGTLRTQGSGRPAGGRSYEPRPLLPLGRVVLQLRGASRMEWSRPPSPLRPRGSVSSPWGRRVVCVCGAGWLTYGRPFASRRGRRRDG